jgi:hypothetical protein
VNKKVFLHIGTEKTGSTSIQRFCQLNRRRLQKHDVYYPRSVGDESHHLLAGAFLPEARRHDFCPKLDSEKILKALKSEIQRAPCSKILLSCEQLSSRFDVEHIEALRQFLEDCGVEVQIMLYIREQDDFLISSYSTAVRGRLKLPISIDMATKNQRRYNYLALLDRWSAQFPDIRVRVFEPAQLIGKDLMADFCYGLGFRLEHASFELLTRQNTALAPDLLEYKRLVNVKIWDDSMPIKKSMRLSRTLVNELEQLSSPYAGYTLLTQEQRHAVLDAYAESNREVARRYLGKNGPLFSSLYENDQLVYRGLKAEDRERIEREVKRSRSLLNVLFGIRRRG